MTESVACCLSLPERQAADPQILCLLPPPYGGQQAGRRLSTSTLSRGDYKQADASRGLDRYSLKGLVS